MVLFRGLKRRRIIGAALLVVATPAWAGPLEVTSQIFVEKRVPLADGTVRTDLVPATRAAPGDRVTVIVRYRNTGVVPIADVAIGNPVPRGLVFRAGQANAAGPQLELSVNGRDFASLPALAVPLPGGGSRPARPEDVTAVRWRLPAPLPAKAAGQFSFATTIR